LYATGAYLTREPTLLAQLKAGDVTKLLIMALMVVATFVSTCSKLRFDRENDQYNKKLLAAPPAVAPANAADSATPKAPAPPFSLTNWLMPI